MLSKDFIRETWEIETGVSEQGVEWDVIGFARAIERAAREEAIRECAKACQSIANNTDWVDRFRDGAAECADVLRALREGS
jgi:hypothetical protein